MPSCKRTIYTIYKCLIFIFLCKRYICCKAKCHLLFPLFSYEGHWTGSDVCLGDCLPFRKQNFLFFYVCKSLTYRCKNVDNEAVLYIFCHFNHSTLTCLCLLAVSAYLMNHRRWVGSGPYLCRIACGNS